MNPGPSRIWMPFTQMSQAPAPHLVVRGQGAYLELAGGKRILDAVSSWWVTLHGHGRPELAEAIYKQALELEQVIAAGYSHEPAQRLAKVLVERLPPGLEWVFYSDDGSTAVEVALKMAFQYWANRGEKKRQGFLALEGGYHGDTLGAMSVGDPSLFNPVFSPLLFGATRLPRPITWTGDLEVEAKEAQALAQARKVLEQDPERFGVLIVEPLVQGAAGMRMYRPGFLKALVELVREFGLLVIFDEVATGFGRTGKLFACEWAGVEPDLICLSKGLTGGAMALAATVANHKVYEAFWGDQNSPQDPTFYHGHSFTANPLGCAAALASMKLLDQTQVYGEMAVWHQEGQAQLQGIERLGQFRIQGTIGAMDWAPQKGAKHNNLASLKEAFFERGFLLRPLGSCLYLLPPYCITKEELLGVYGAIRDVMTA